MIEHDYSDPVAKILPFGFDRLEDDNVTDYISLGLTNEHVPELIRLMNDPRWNDIEWEDEPGPEVYARVHAWRALAQLGAVEVIPAALELFQLIDDEDDEWVESDLPIVIGSFGEKAIEPCRAYLLDPQNGLYARVAAVDSIREIAKAHSETRTSCVNALVLALESYKLNDPYLNGFIIYGLIDLQAVEAAPLVEKAYLDDMVDLQVNGDYEDFQVELGLLDKRITPPKGLGESKWRKILSAEAELQKELKRKKEAAKKAKAKNSQAKKARKKNKKH